ncbi:MAG: glycosyl hydrolase family 8 [Mycobacteriales bacterium]
MVRIAVVAGLAVALVSCGGGHGDRGGTPTRSAGPPAVGAFLHRYVRADGRVDRPDQGGDTVSEGQAYGLLLAQVAGDRAVFERIWGWTRDHLRNRDGLFSFHADAGGHVLDRQPATDADLLIAWALLRDRNHHADGRRVAAAILAHETVAAPGAGRLLAAGPWATGRPATLNPSYWALPALRDLARLTGDARWRDLAAGVVPLTRQFTAYGSRLPTDWLALDPSGAVRPEPAPGGTPPDVRYGLDAQRLVVWLAAACDPAARSLAARWWPLLRDPARGAALALGLDGTPRDPTSAVLLLVASAAAARAAGDTAASDRLLDRADDQQRTAPTYYGGAWAALGRVLLTTTALRAR